MTGVWRIRGLGQDTLEASGEFCEIVVWLPPSTNYARADSYRYPEGPSYRRMRISIVKLDRRIVEAVTKFRYLHSGDAEHVLVGRDVLQETTSDEVPKELFCTVWFRHGAAIHLVGWMDDILVLPRLK